MYILGSCFNFEKRMSLSRNNELPLQPYVLLAIGFVIGQTSQGPAAIEKFYYFVDHALVPLYAILVLLYLFGLIFRKEPKVVRRAVPSVAPVDLIPERKEGEPINMTGAYKLVEIKNFEAFLEVQGTLMQK